MYVYIMYIHIIYIKHSTYIVEFCLSVFFFINYYYYCELNGRILDSIGMP